MQQITRYLIIPALILIAVSCKKSNPTSYDSEAMIYIYKDGFNTNKDSVIASFAIKNDNLLIDTVFVPVRIMGVASGADREVKLEPIAALSNAIEGTHYQLLPYKIAAGAYSANLPVVVKRTADLKSKEFRLVLGVKETKDFKPGAVGVANSAIPGAALNYLVKINDFLTKPVYWDSNTIYYFGTYSAAKFKFMIQVTGLTAFKLPDNMGLSEAAYYNLLCKNALAAYEAVNGPMLDESGIRVAFL